MLFQLLYSSPWTYRTVAERQHNWVGLQTFPRLEFTITGGGRCDFCVNVNGRLREPIGQSGSQTVDEKSTAYLQSMSALNMTL